MLETFRVATAEHRTTATTLTDNGMEFTTRTVRGTNSFEWGLVVLGVK